MVGFTRAMNDEGVATLRFNFPYMEGGQRGRRTGRRSRSRRGARPSTCAAARARGDGEPVWASGKSLRRPDGVDGGGRGACRRPDSSSSATRCIRRASPSGSATSTCTAITVPMLFLAGHADPFATPARAGTRDRRSSAAARHAAPDRGRRPLVRGPGRQARSRARSPPRSRRSWRRSCVSTGERDVLMPRKNRRNPEYFEAPEAPPARADAPMWAAGARVRRPARGRPEGVPVPGLRPHGACRELAPRRRARRRRRRPAALAHRVLAHGAPAPGLVIVRRPRGWTS